MTASTPVTLQVYSTGFKTGSSVMPGLVPGISIGAIAAAEVDARNKSGHDDKKA